MFEKTNTNVIYDFGCNNGQNIPYYLLKSDIVVAVDANPFVLKQISQRFNSEIQNKKLIVHNCILTTNFDCASIDGEFYIHKTTNKFPNRHAQSQYLKPSQDKLKNFDLIIVKKQSVLDLINSHGYPLYIKIDLEHYDSVILECLFNNKIYPKYISVEIQNQSVVDIILSCKKYNSFKLLEGASVHRLYNNVAKKNKLNNIINYSFPKYSAGPFGEDIMGEWLNSDQMYKLINATGLGWKDLHAAYKE